MPDTFIGHVQNEPRGRLRSLRDKANKMRTGVKVHDDQPHRSVESNHCAHTLINDIVSNVLTSGSLLHMLLEGLCSKNTLKVVVTVVATTKTLIDRAHKLDDYFHSLIFFTSALYT